MKWLCKNFWDSEVQQMIWLIDLEEINSNILIFKKDLTLTKIIIILLH